MIRKIEDGIWDGIDWIVRNRKPVAASTLAAIIGSIPWMLIVLLPGGRCG